MVDREAEAKMDAIEVSVVVPLSAERAFEIYVEHIDRWWPRQGVFPYSFAPGDTDPHMILFEPGVGGRLFERFRNRTEYEIGRIVEWDPPRHLLYTWRDPTWEEPIRVALRFEEVEGGTRVSLRDEGFVEVGIGEMSAYYAIGDRQVLGVYAVHCRAVAEFEALKAAEGQG